MIIQWSETFQDSFIRWQLLLQQLVNGIELDINCHAEKESFVCIVTFFYAF